MSQLRNSLSNFWNRIQGTLFPFLEEELDPLTEKQQQLIAILELIRIEEFIPETCGNEGRPLKSRRALARAFVAKIFYNMDTTALLIERLKGDKNLRRICGWESFYSLPSESTFSRAFTEFSEENLPERVHQALIQRTLEEEIILHNSRDSTAIEAREKPVKKPNPKETVEAPKVQKKKGRRKKGEKKAQEEPSRIERQRSMSLEEMIADLPTSCDKGAKKDSHGNVMYWNGYKLHLDTVDGGIPVSAMITSASLHDSQVAIPLATLTSRRITNCYDLMDSAYYVPNIIAHSQELGHVPLIDENPRRDAAMKLELEAEAKARKVLNFPFPEDLRYNVRSTAERANARLKDEFGARKVRVRGHLKVSCHLMLGVLVLAADQLLKLGIQT